MKHYCMMNSHATETSDGFANTWFAVAFATRKERDAAISEGILAARIVLPSERRECERVGQISTLEDFARSTRRL